LELAEEEAVDVDGLGDVCGGEVAARRRRGTASSGLTGRPSWPMRCAMPMRCGGVSM
jgi:hypothetical protein